MVMADTEGSDNPDNHEDSANDVVPPATPPPPPKSPWKTPQPPMVDVPVEAAHADSHSWPALSSLKSPSAADAVATNTSAISPKQVQVPNEPQKSHGRGNHNSSSRFSTRQHKPASKHNPNVAPSFHGPLPFNQPPIPPIYGGMAPWPPHIPVLGYAYQPPAGSFSGPPRGNPNAYGVEFPNRRPNVQEKGDNFTSGRQNNQPLGSKENVDVQQNAGPRAFIRPPFFGPPAGFIGGPTFPGPPGSIVYLPARPPFSVRVPHPPFVVPHPMNPGIPVLPSQTEVRASIIKQIEYYFSDQNLQSDRYLLSLMDAHGWVPISTIADFKRVKSMSTDIPFIVDALQSSTTLEVQDDKVRRREEWSKWIPTSVGNKSTLMEEKSEVEVIDSLNKDSVRDKFQGTDECSESKAANGGDEKPKAVIHGQSQASNKVNEISLKFSRQNLDDTSDDFGSTFMFDEELELEHKSDKKDQCSSKTRMDDEDDEMIVNDQAVERLVIVTQQNNSNGEGAKGVVKETKPFSNELASAINDGLYYYEQELKSKRGKGRRNNLTNEMKDGISKSPKVSSPTANHKAISGSFCENSNSRRKQNKGFSNSKQQPLKNQRWFSSNLQNQLNKSHQIYSMSKESWNMAATLCDSCKTTSAALFCRADSAFLCIPCDGKVHAANKLASRHARVWMCDVCERAPASFTCKADAATLCVTCDREIHSANPLARRHERFPVVPFYDPATAVSKVGGGGDNDNDNNDHHFLLDFDVNVAGTEAEEAEAASWLIPDPNINKIVDGSEDDNKSEYLFNEIDPYLDIDLKTPDQKANQIIRRYNSPTDGVVPVQNKIENRHYQMPPHAHASSPDVVEGLPAYDVDYTGSKPFMYNFTSQSVSQSVSSSSLEIEVGVVPDHNANATMADVSNNHHHPSLPEVYPTPVSGFDREARVLRYKEKRKNRRFEKTIRYASRKAYAETRPRIKGRFAKRTEIDLEVEDTFISPDSSYGIVPSY